MHNPSPPRRPQNRRKARARDVCPLRPVLRAACSQARLPRRCHQEYIDFINPLAPAS